MNNTNQTCESCRNWYMPLTQCRFRAPIVPKHWNETMAQIVGNKAVWPVTDPADFCAQWQKSFEPETAAHIKVVKGK